jgi:hypothetical protein
MNDELTQSLVQPLTRCSALKKFGVGLTGLRGSLSSAHDYRVDTEEALVFINDVVARVNAGQL